MKNEHLVKVLIEKRAEIAGIVEGLEREVAQHRAALIHLDSTLRLLDPSIKIGEIRSKRMSRRSGYFAPGELSKSCLDAIRIAGDKGVSAEEVAVSMMAAKGIEQTDEILRTEFIKRIHNAMDRLHRSQVVRRVGRGLGVRWALREEP